MQLSLEVVKCAIALLLHLRLATFCPFSFSIITITIIILHLMWFCYKFRMLDKRETNRKGDEDEQLTTTAKSKIPNSLPLE